MNDKYGQRVQWGNRVSGQSDPSPGHGLYAEQNWGNQPYGTHGNYGQSGYGAQSAYGEGPTAQGGYQSGSGFGATDQQGWGNPGFQNQSVDEQNWGNQPQANLGPSSYRGTRTNLESQRGRYQGKGPKGYQRSDERIREDVCDRLSEGYLDASELEVTVTAGEVTLTGSVYDRNHKHIAEELVELVPGVQEIHNQLRVKRETGKESEGGEAKQSRPRSGPETRRSTIS